MRYRCLALLIAILPPLAIAQSGADKAGSKPIPVKVYTVTAAAGRTQIAAVGTLSADESVVIRPEQVGRIVALDFTEGAAVAKGRALVRLDDTEYQARLRQAEAEARLLEERLTRAESLFARQFVSEQAVIDARQNLLMAKARIDEAKALLAKTVLRAPFNGVIGIRQVSPGAYVKEGQDIVSLSKLDRLKLDMRVPEIHLGALRQAGEISVSVDAWPDRRFPARIQVIDPTVDTASRTLLVRALVNNRGGELKPGMFARVSVALGPQTSVRVPEEAVVAKPGQFFVYRVEAGKARPVTIAPGRREPGWVEVVKGLRAGDTIITEGQLRLKPGAAVQPLAE